MGDITFCWNLLKETVSQDFGGLNLVSIDWCWHQKPAQTPDSGPKHCRERQSLALVMLVWTKSEVPWEIASVQKIWHAAQLFSEFIHTTVYCICTYSMLVQDMSKIEFFTFLVLVFGVGDGFGLINYFQPQQSVPPLFICVSSLSSKMNSVWKKKCSSGLKKTHLVSLKAIFM